VVDRVLDQHRPELLEEGMACGALDADIGGDATQQQGTDPALAEVLLEPGAGKPVIACLGHYQFTRLRAEGIDDLPVPTAIDQQFSRQRRPVAHQPQRQLLVVGG